MQIYQSLIEKFSSNHRLLFLIDGIGAVVSAFFLGVVLVQFEQFFGMPKSVLFWLSLMACCYAVYSLACYFFVGSSWRPYMRIIAWANSLHCLVTIIFLTYYHEQLTLLGWAYFVGEIIIVSTLIAIERKTYL